MKKIIILLTVIALLPFVGKSQKPPGYMGMHMAVKYNFSIWAVPYFIFGKGEEQGSAFKLRTSHTGEINYCIARKIDVNFHYGVSRFTYQLEEANNYGTPEYHFLPKRKEYILSATAIGGGFRIFVSDFAAPMGNYLRFNYSSVTIGYIPASEKVVGSSTYYNQALGMEVKNDVTLLMKEKYKVNKIHIGIGAQRPVARRIFFDYSMGINFHFSSDWSTHSKQGSISSEKMNEAMYKKYSTYFPYRAAHMMDISIGLGFMLF